MHGSVEVKQNIARGLYVALIVGCCAVPMLAQMTFSKGQVADRIRKVEDGVDEFRKWSEQKGDTAKSNAQTAEASGRTRRNGKTSNEAQKQTAQQTKNDLNDALSDLNRSTNRLRRKFDPLDKWMETKAQMQQVLDDGRRINQVMVRGNYGSQAEKYWAALRNNINDLARCYGLAPMGA
jgi:predicted RNase H-like nuclease (RuvC/YqgF family)